MHPVAGQGHRGGLACRVQSSAKPRPTPACVLCVLRLWLAMHKCSSGGLCDSIQE